MRPAVLALGMALFLFLLVQGIRPPVLYIVLLVPVAIFGYGLVANDLPVEKFEDEADEEEERVQDSDGR